MKVEFKFDERSLVSLEKLKEQGHQFREIKAGERTILVPLNCGFRCVQPHQNPKKEQHDQ